MVAFYRRRPDATQVAERLTTRPDGTPAPTGYFPNRTNPQQGRAGFSPTNEQLYGSSPASGDPGLYAPDRVELLLGEQVDQHPWLQVTSSWTPAPNLERPDGRNDPLTDGPAQPTPRQLSMYKRTAGGTSVTRYLDAPGRVFPSNGSQDGSTWTYYADAQRQLDPYNPNPGETEMPDSLRALPPSPAHGWTERAVFNAKEADNDKMRQLHQQQGPHQDRLASSTYAGQSFGADTTHIGTQVSAGSYPSRRSRG